MFCEVKDVICVIKNGGEDFNKKCLLVLIFYFIIGLLWEYEWGYYLLLCVIVGYYFCYVGNVLYFVISIYG